MVRSCNFYLDADVIAKKKVKLCLDYHIKKCEGPCEGVVSAERYNAMIDQAAVLLKGKTETLCRDVARGDGSAGDAEEVRGSRGDPGPHPRAWRPTAERQKAVDLDARDRDIMAYAAENDDACGVIFKVRDGKMIGRQHYYMNSVEGKPPAEILATMVQQHYLEAQEIPQEVPGLGGAG